METTAVECGALRRIRVHEPCEQDAVTLLTTQFERFYRTVYGYLAYRLFDRELAEELTAQTFSKAAGAIHRLRGDAPYLRAWLLRTANNLATTHGRQTQRRRLLLERFARVRAPTAEADPAPGATGAQPRGRLQAALSALPPNDQTVVVLRYYAQMSFEEIAQVLQCRPGAVRTRLTRAIKKMRRQLGVKDKEKWSNP